MKYSLKANLSKLAPNENQYCKVFLLNSKKHWKEIANHLLNVIKEYPASKAFWYTDKKVVKNSINLKKIKSNIDHDLNLLNTNAKHNEDDVNYPTLSSFLEDVKTIFKNTELYVEKETRKYQYSNAVKRFINYLVEKENIFGNQDSMNQRRYQQPVTIQAEQNQEIIQDSESSSKDDLKIVCNIEDDPEDNHSDNRYNS